MKKSTIFYNYTINKKELKTLLSSAFLEFGNLKTSFLATKLKDLGFLYATKAGISISIEDLRVPPTKSMLMRAALKKVEKAGYEAEQGKITEVERYLQIINIWSTTSEALKDRVVEYFKTKDPLNSVYMMAFSGARGNVSQVRQLVGMRGLMSDPSGQIIDIPIKANFKEGLTVSDYIISSYGARKGLVDTALRTADSGYLTRRLVDVAQDVVTREHDCKTKFGIGIKTSKTNKVKDQILGRVLGQAMIDQLLDENKKWFVNEKKLEINLEIAEKLASSNFSHIIVRSPLTCQLARAVCQKCYGWDLTIGNLVDLGAAVGIIAGQSIGEPGTQLTMRTFHTGGVFNSEPNRQVRADASGKLYFSLGLKTKKNRSKFGELVLISENVGSLEIISYKNKKKLYNLPPESVMFIKNFSFVKKNESLFELPLLTAKTKEARSLKNVIANLSGEVSVKKENLRRGKSSLKKKHLNTLVWVVSGQVYCLPGQGYLNVTPFSWTQMNQSLCQSTVSSYLGGKIKLSTEANSNKIESIEIFQLTNSFKNLKIYIETQHGEAKDIVLYGRKRSVISLETTLNSSSIKDAWFPIGGHRNTVFTTRTGGTFYCHETQIHGNIINTVFYVPEATIKTNCSFSDLKVKDGEEIKKNTFLFKKRQSTISGIIEIQHTNKIIDAIAIKPGYKILLTEANQLEASLYHEQVVFKGEVLLSQVKIERCSYVELKKFDHKSFLIITPIVRYEIQKENTDLENFPTSTFFPNEVKLGPTELKFISGQKLKTLYPIEWLNHPLLLKLKFYGKNILIEATFETIKKKPWFTLFFSTKELFHLKSLIPNEVSKENFFFHTLVQNNQYVESYTIVAVLQILSSIHAYIYSIKQQFYNRQRRILLTTNKDYKPLYFEERNLKAKLKNFVTPEQELCTNLLSEVSGFVETIQGNQVSIRLAQPYLFSLGGRIQIPDKYFLKKDESIGQLFYTRARTEDIVQGLPKVEELLEARKSTFVSVLAKRPGMITQIYQTYSSMKIWVSSVPRKINVKEKKSILNFRYSDVYSLNYGSRLVVGLGQFVNVGQPLENKGINPNAILDTYFQYYQNLEKLSLREAAFRSFQVAQIVILSSVQNVYSSQGVTISDKHLEIIVKQMTKKVEIVLPGDTNLLQKESLDFSQINYINSCVKSVNKPFYKPILLGITRASLKTDSFLSRASFQQTTQVLTEAAIQGKTDWLRGLKENVITGSLIPAGTGFYAYMDISYLLTKVPNSKSSSKGLHSKYDKLRKLLDFKLEPSKNFQTKTATPKHTSSKKGKKKLSYV